MTSRPDLRPRTIGENLDAGFKLFTSNFRVLVTLAAVIFIPIALLTGLISTAMGDFNIFDLVLEEDSANIDDFLTGFGRFLLLSMVTALITFIGTLVLQAATARVIGDAYQGETTSWQDGVRFGLRRFFSVLVITIIILILIFAGVIVVGIAVFITALISEGLAIAVGIFGMAGGLVALYTLAYLAVPAMVVESLSPTQAIGRSARLVSKRFWPTFFTGVLAALIVGVIGGIVSVIVQISTIGPALVTSTDTGTISGGLLVGVNSVTSALVNIFSVPFTASVAMAIYFDLRVRLEGFDIELLAREMQELDATPGEIPQDPEGPFGLDAPE